MKKKILAFTFFFPPDRSNECRRIQKIIKVLKQEFDFEVLCADHAETARDDHDRWQDVFHEGLKIHRFSFLDTGRWSRFPLFGRLLFRIFRLEWQWGYFLVLFFWVLANRKRLCDFHYIYLPPRPWCFLILVLWMKILDSRCRVVLDFRFLFYLEPHFYRGGGRFNYLFFWLDRFLLRKVCHHSDICIGITRGVSELLQKETGKDFVTVDQGFDPQDFNVNHKERLLPSEKIHILYAGNLVPSASDPDGIARFVLKFVDLQPQAKFHFAGNAQALKKILGEKEFIQYHGYLKSVDLINLMSSVSVLFLYYDDNGMSDFRVGTKTYDYVAMKKPVICFCSKNSGTYAIFKKASGFFHCDSTTTDEEILRLNLKLFSEQKLKTECDYSVNSLLKTSFGNFFIEIGS